MLKTVKHIVLFCLMAGGCNSAYATHAAGMDITYQCVGGSSSSSGVQITVTINTDYYGNEITWTITNSSGVVVASGGPYAYGANTYTVTACVPIGTLNFNWYDSYGDGWNWAGIQGSYSVTQGSATLTSGSPSSGSSGSSTFYVSGGTPCTTSTSSQYLITVKFYRDCYGISAPGSMILNYSSASCGQNGSATLSQISGGQEITPICPGYTTTCQSFSASITGIQEYTYQATITLPAQCSDWVLSVCECCRNNAITTINSPGSQNLCVEAIINNTNGVTPCNNSPTFSVPPVPFICNSMTYCYNNGATDIDGDSLVYSLVTPLSTANGGTVTYNGGYSVNNPAGGTTMFDPITGNLCLTTTSTLITVIAIKVSEYRNGVFIGSVIRDIQVNVINCNNTPPVLSGFGGSPTNVSTNSSSSQYTFCADGSSTINLTINGSDPNNSNNLNMVWNSAIPGASFNVIGNNTNSPIGTFSWTPTAANASSIPYYFTVSVTDDACPINASYSYSYSITITANPDAGISNNISVCETDPPFNLFSQLGGSPTTGGTWYDSNSNITSNSFDPATDSAGVFTYVLDSAGNCPGDSSTINVLITPPPNAGLHGNITVCTADPPFNLLSQLTGNPLATGIWTNSSGQVVVNIFDPSIMSSEVFTYTVLGAGTCADDTASVSVIVNTSPTASLTVNSPICSGDSAILNITLNGQGPFTSTITDGNNSNTYNLGLNGLQTNGQAVSFTPATTTTYVITSLSDQTTCINLNPISATVTVVQPPNAGIGGSVSVCTNDSVIDLNAYLSGATINGIWTNPLNNIISNIFNPNTQNGGNFTYTISAAPCPNNSATVSVTVNNPPTVVASASPVTICNGDPTTLSGSGANTYSWNNGVTNGLSFNPTSTNTYTVIGTDINGCTNTDMITVNVNILPNVIANANPATICNGDPTTLSGSGANTYSWNNGVTNGLSFNPTSTNTYTVIGTDINGCTNTDMITVNVNILPNVIANANPATICNGDPTTLSGSGANTYSWNNGVTNGLSFNPTSTNTYTVIGTDINGCIGTNQVAVNVNSIPVASLVGMQDICVGDSVTLSFSLIGNAPFTVDFTDGTNNFSSILDNNGNLLAGNSIIFSPTSSTTYNITSVSDVNACSNTASGSELIIVYPLPTAIISGGTTICAGNNTPLSFSLNGLPPFTLNYTDGISNFNVVLDSVGNTSSGPLLVSPTTNTIFTLIDITDNNGCFNSLSDTTMIAIVQTSSAGSNDTATFCGNDMAFDMLLELGGNPANGGVWTDAAGNTVSNLFDPATSTAGIYTYTVNAAPCPSTNADLIVNINSIPTISISGTDTICIGDSSDLSFVLTGLAPFNVDYTDSTNNFNVNLDANGNEASSGFPISHYPLINTDYIIIGITDANGCSNTGSGIADKIVNPLPNITISGGIGICIGDSTDLSFSVWEGTAPFNVTLNDGTANSYWLMDNNGAVNGLPVTISPNNSTTYSLVDVTDANGCWNALNGNTTITIYDLPTAYISGTAAICEGEDTPITFTLQNGLPPYNVNYKVNGVITSSFFNISGLNTIMASPSTSTIYSLVDITDGNNCFNTVSDSITVDVNEKVDAIISGGGAICNDGSQATINVITTDSTFVHVTYTNGFMPTTLSGNGPFEIITNQAGIYMITDVIDIYGCDGTYSGNATITINPLPSAEFGFFPQPTDLDNPHINFINSSFGHTNAIWDFGDGSILSDTLSKLLHTYQDTGHYKVTLLVSNDFGCTDSIAYTIIINPIFIIYIPDAFTPNNDGINDAFGPSVYGISEFEMKIYNRWGQVVYHTTEQNKPWDGTINNRTTQGGVFSYSIVATDLKEKPHKFVGTFTLLR